MANERRTFGVKRDESENNKQQPASSTGTVSNNQKNKVQFGVKRPTADEPQVQVDQRSSEQRFGPGAQSKTPSANSGVLQELFQLKDKAFWLKAYGLSVVFWLFLGNGQFSLTTLLNVILFPFVLILLAEIAELLSGMPTIAQWLYPATNQLSREGWLKRVLWYGSKLVLYFFLWKFSFILGLIGVVMLVKAMSKSRG